MNCFFIAFHHFNHHRKKRIVPLKVRDIWLAMKSLNNVKQNKTGVYLVVNQCDFKAPMNY